LHGIVNTPDEFAVKCDLTTARALLAIAERHCKAAVSPIQVAIHEAEKRGQTWRVAD